MHVGLNLIYLMPGRTGGMETVARELIPALAAARPDVRLTAFVNREAASEQGPWREAAEWVPLPVRASSRLDWVRAEQTLLPRAAAAAGVELLHSLGATAPLWGPFRRVVSVYDFNYKLYPETHNPLYGRGLDLLVRLGARRSDRVLTCSQSTRIDAERLLSVPGERIDVVPLGLGAARDVAPTPERELRDRYGLDPTRQLVLTFSDRRPHKNLLRLIEATRDGAYMLVIAGYVTAYERELRAGIADLGLEERVRLLPWVSDADREGLYELALGFVFPSLYEGFGLPVLEAMARGVPVACSNAASLPEVAGDAALLFDPHDTQAIATALRRILGDPHEAERLRVAGRERAAQFSWEATAAGTLACYERTLSGWP
ncbi:MAG TPA: glycosyltransferase family 1 protein [Solirubrobacteraceae bacterium]|jgi:glycosyltransferase involved in cell wall biosynthesis|nr:glycosyltransferase family 1 protein [Solirubrobacteraceae bacterium]